MLVESIEALCICLKQYTYPCRNADLVPSFGRPVPQLCMITNLVVDYLLDRFGDLLYNLNQGWLSPQSLQVYADGIHNKGAALDNCGGFIDGTVRPICRPKENQRMVYNGHKRVHALKFQSIVTPNGLIANLFGPVEGRRHDNVRPSASTSTHVIFTSRSGNVYLWRPSISAQGTSSMPICTLTGTNSCTGSIQSINEPS